MKNKQQNQNKQSSKTNDCGKNSEHKAKQNTGSANRSHNNRQQND